MLLSRATALSLTLVTLAACGGSSPAAPGGGNPNLPNMSAKIDGVLWEPTLAVQAVNFAPGLYTITAFRNTGANSYTMVLSLYNIKGPGTYPLGVITTVFGGSAVLSLPPSGGWSTPLNGTAGVIVITTLTATRMVATFNFDTAPLQAGSPGNPKVTEGRLDIPVTGTGGFALANQGSKMSGNIGGTFVASAVAGSLTNAGGSNPIFTLVANNGTRSITMSIANMTGQGTYPLQATTPVRSIQTSGMPGNLTATWGSQLAGGSGSITISSVTADRFIGSFTGTLMPVAGGATGSLPVSGTFELARLFF
jgi:hypothetical protein